VSISLSGLSFAPLRLCGRLPYLGSFEPTDGTNVIDPDCLRSRLSGTATGSNVVFDIVAGASVAAFTNVLAENFGAFVFVSALVMLFASIRDSRVAFSRFTATAEFVSVTLTAVVLSLSLVTVSVCAKHGKATTRRATAATE